VSSRANSIQHVKSYVKVNFISIGLSPVEASIVAVRGTILYSSDTITRSVCLSEYSIYLNYRVTSIQCGRHLSSNYNPARSSHAKAFQSFLISQLHFGNFYRHTASNSQSSELASNATLSVQLPVSVISHHIQLSRTLALLLFLTRRHHLQELSFIFINFGIRFIRIELMFNTFYDFYSFSSLQRNFRWS